MSTIPAYLPKLTLCINLYFRGDWECCDCKGGARGRKKGKFSRKGTVDLKKCFVCLVIIYKSNPSNIQAIDI